MIILVVSFLVALVVFGFVTYKDAQRVKAEKLALLKWRSDVLNCLTKISNK